LLERVELLFGAMNHPDWFSAPFDGAHFARGNPANIHFDRRAGCPSFFARGEGTHEGDREGRTSYSANGTGRADPEAT
jgi:hypothetical protein